MLAAAAFFIAVIAFGFALALCRAAALGDRALNWPPEEPPAVDELEELWRLS